MATLKIVRPVTVTDAILYSSDVPETDYAEWAVGTTYTLGQRVIRTSTHKVYESANNTNLGNTPETSPTLWIEVSPTNPWKMFDTSNTTQTAKSGSMSVTLRPNTPCNSLVLLNVTQGLTLRVRVSDPTYGLLYDHTSDLSTLPPASDWWSWFFGVRKTTSQSITLDLPHIRTADIIVDLTGGTGLAVGVMLIGQNLEIGTGVEYGAKLGIQDYSRKETNDWGETLLVKRSFAKRASFSMAIPSSDVDAVHDLLVDLRATPCLWIGTSEYSVTTIYGFYKEFGVVISYPTFSDCTLDIEGLT